MKHLLLFAILIQASFAFAQNRSDVVQEKHGSITYRYIVPNEMYPERMYDSKISGYSGGAVISVGTLRSFYLAGAQRADELIMLDYDQHIQEFNRLHVKLLERASNRFEYVAEFFSTDLNFELVQQVRNGSISFQRFLTLTLEQPYRTPSQADALEFQEMLDQEVQNPIRSTLRSGFKRHFQIQAGRKTGTSAFYWLNDQVYDHLRNLALTQRISVLNGSWSGVSTVQSLAESLRKSKQRVSVVDLSNLMEWISDRALDSKNVQPLINFEKNLKSLPLTADTRIQFTLLTERLENFYPRPSSGGKFTYATLPADRFLSYVATPRSLDSESVYRVVLKKSPDADRPPSAIHRLFGDFASTIGRCFLK